MIITLAQLTLDHIQPIKNATATEVKRIKEIIASGKLADYTYFKVGRKEFFFSVDNKRIAVEVVSGGSVNLYGVPECCISNIYIDTKEGYTVLSQEDANAITKKEQQRQDETDTIIALCDAQYEGQIITIDQKWDASQLTCDVMEGWIGESCQIDFSAPEDDFCVMEYDYYSPGAVELYSYVNNCDVVELDPEPKEVIADKVKTRYEAWVASLPEKGESHKILSFEGWKAKKQENKALTARQKQEKEEKARLLNEQSETLNQIRRIEGWSMTYSAYLKWCERWEKPPLSQDLFHHAMKQLKVKYSI